MGMQTDVKAISLAASGAVTDTRVFNVLIPAEGILCLTSAYATLSNAKVTVFYA